MTDINIIIGISLFVGFIMGFLFGGAYVYSTYKK